MTILSLAGLETCLAESFALGRKRTTNGYGQCEPYTFFLRILPSRE